MSAVLVLATVAALGAASPAGAATPKTLLTFQRPAVRFAQDGNRVAWIERTKGKCALAVFVFALPKGPARHAGGCIPSDLDVPNCNSCHDLDIALNAHSVMWTQLRRTGAGISIDVKAASLSAPSRGQQLFGFYHDVGGGAGTFLTGFSADGNSLLFSTARFLAGGDLPCPDDTSKGCTIVSSGGGVYQAGTPFPNGPTVRLLAAAGADAAWVQYPLGAVTAGTTDQVHIATRDGLEAATIDTGGTVHAIAATPTMVAALVTPASGPLAGTQTLATWDIGETAPNWQVAVPAHTDDRISTDGRAIVLLVNSKTIMAARVADGAIRTLGTAGRKPNGLSIESCRVAWLEPFRKGSKLRSLTAC